MRLVITDTGFIWNQNNPFLEKYKDIVLIICLYGKTVTDQYPSYLLRTEDSTQVKEEVERLSAMSDGKKICSMLRKQRIRLAKANHIPFKSGDCPFTELCVGTCEKCHAESEYLKEQLQKIPEEKCIYPQFEPEGEIQV